MFQTADPTILRHHFCSGPYGQRIIQLSAGNWNSGECCDYSYLLPPPGLSLSTYCLRSWFRRTSPRPRLVKLDRLRGTCRALVLTNQLIRNARCTIIAVYLPYSRGCQARETIPLHGDRHITILGWRSPSTESLRIVGEKKKGAICLPKRSITRPLE